MIPPIGMLAAIIFSVVQMVWAINNIREYNLKKISDKEQRTQTELGISRYAENDSYLIQARREVDAIINEV
jgi:hypothetical protein